MADYDKMIKDSRDAARYEDIRKQLTGCKKAINRFPAYIFISASCSAGFLSCGKHAITNETQGGFNENAGYIMFAAAALSILCGVVSGIRYGKTKKRQAALTEELKGLEAKLQE